MIIGFTGHRPQKLGGFKIPNPTYLHITNEIEKILLKEKPEKIISGMALGVDMWAAQIAIKLQIPFIAAVPFLGQEKMWPYQSKQEYFALLDKAEHIEYVSEPGYSAEKLQIRNEYIVDNCDVLVAVFDGSNSGTKNCITYAENQNKNTILINPFESSTEAVST